MITGAGSVVWSTDLGLGFGDGSAAGLRCSKRSLPSSQVQASEQCDDSLGICAPNQWRLSIWIEMVQILLVDARNYLWAGCTHRQCYISSQQIWRQYEYNRHNIRTYYYVDRSDEMKHD